jgi:hypothetical protein
MAGLRGHGRTWGPFHKSVVAGVTHKGPQACQAGGSPLMGPMEKAAKLESHVQFWILSPL